MPLPKAPAGDSPYFKRRVLIVTQKFPAPFDRRVWQQAAALTRNGYAVSIVCPRGMGYDAPHEELDGVHIYRYPTPAPLFGSTALLAWQLMAAGRIFLTPGFDVIHISGAPGSAGLIGGFFKLFFDKKVLFDYCGAPERPASLSFRERMAFKTADAVIAASDNCREAVIGLAKKPPQNVFTVCQAPDLQWLAALAPMLSIKQANSYLVGYAGSISAEAGVPLIIEAARILTQDRGRQDIRFVLAGGGGEFEAMRKLASLQGVADYVTFAPRLSGHEGLEALGGSDICVCLAGAPADMAMECMALGKPVILPAGQEARACAGDAALYVPPGDAQSLAHGIVSLLDDPDKRKAMAETGRARAQRDLSWTDEEPKLLAAYDTLFKRRKKK